jgi:hypothetical protein
MSAVLRSRSTGYSRQNLIVTSTTHPSPGWGRGHSAFLCRYDSGLRPHWSNRHGSGFPLTNGWAPWAWRFWYLVWGCTKRVAQRTIEQQRIMANNLSIRRACESLKSSASFSEICLILEEAFKFDRFELRFPSPAGCATNVSPLAREKGDTIRYTWAKSGNGTAAEGSCWSLALPLSSTGTWRQGAFVLFRSCGPVPLRMDVNLLTSYFQQSVSQALDRAVSQTAMPSGEDGTCTITATAS